MAESQRRRVANGRKRAYWVERLFLDTASHEVPHERLQADGVVGGESRAEWHIQRHIAGGNGEVRDSKHCVA